MTEVRDNLTITSHTLALRTADELVEAVRLAETVTFELAASFRADAMKVAMLAAGLSERERKVIVRLPNGNSAGVRESMRQSLFVPQVLTEEIDREIEFSSADLCAAYRATNDGERRIFSAPTALLHTAKARNEYSNILGGWLAGAQIRLPPAMQDAVASLVFEVTSNAEEHGSVRYAIDSTLEIRPVMRQIVVRLQSEPGWPQPDDAVQYLERYSRSFAERTRWLEISVVDAGMGVQYPSFRTRAELFGTPGWNVYEMDHEVERGQLIRVLAGRASTKGRYGRALSETGPTGRGLVDIAAWVVTMRGHASIRSGRFAARLSAPDAIMGGTRRNDQRCEYEVEQYPRPLFLGTAWQLLVPLDQQTALAL